MAITKEKKAEILQDLVEKFGKSKTVVFSDYRGLDVSSISDLRNKLRESGSEAKVAKKTLIKLAVKENNLGEIGDDIMKGPVAVTFSYEDEFSGLKVLFNFSKDNENLKLLGGIIDGKIVSGDEIIALAKLPSKEELYAKLLGSLNSPISGFVGIASNLISGFVRVLNAYKDTLPTEETVAPEPTSEPTPESVAEEADSGPVEGEPVKSAETPAEDEKPADETPADDTPVEEATPTTESEDEHLRNDEEKEEDKPTENTVLDESADSEDGEEE